jgi:hypothetical protein
MTTVKHPDTMLTELRALKRRVAVLEGQSRLAAARIPGGQLNVGAVTAPNQIQVDAANQVITLLNGGLPVQLGAFGTEGAALSTAAPANSPGSSTVLATSTYAWVGNAFAFLASQLQSNALDGRAVLQTAMTDDGAGGAIANSNIIVQSTANPDKSTLNVSTTGGVVLYSYARSTDPPAPGLGAITMYVKANRLYYIDGTSTVHGPL